MTGLALTLTTITLLAASGCRDRGEDLDGEAAELTSDSTAASQAEATLLTAMLEGVDGATAEDVAAAIAARAEERYPAACADVAQAGARVTIEFADCRGPRGLRALDGALVLEVERAAGTSGAIEVVARASELRVGATTLSIDAEVTYVPGRIDVATRSTGVGPLGYALAHVGDYEIAWTANCVAIDGAWASERGDAARSTEVAMERCVDACPTGEISRRTVRGRTIALSYDGSDQAAWSTSGGRNGSFPLACGL